MSETTEIPLVNFSNGSNSSNAGDGKQVLPRDMSTELHEYELVAPSGVPLRVYHQAAPSKSAILTYHDIGTNHTSFLGFFAYPEMRVILRNFNIYHVCAPGHYEGAEAIISPPGSESSGGFFSSLWNWGSSVAEVSSKPSHYPTMDELAEMLTTVVDYFKIDHFIGFGMGAGSNVLARYAVSCRNGTSIVICSSITRTILQRGIFTDTLMAQLEAHWFGYGLADNEDLVAFYTQLAQSLNPVNLAGYIDSYINRTDLGLARCEDPMADFEEREKEVSDKPPTAIKVDCCLVTGGLASELARALIELNGRMDPAKTQYLIIPDCNGFVMEEEPARLAVNFLHFMRNEGFVINMTPERLRQEAADLQMQIAQRTAEALPSSAYILEQEA
nr:protein NDRG3 [Hymenolepis microstoma]